MTVYQIELRSTDRKEMRLAEQPPPVGEAFEMAGRVWVAHEAETGVGGYAARFTCIELREESRRLRDGSLHLLERSAETEGVLPRT